MRSIEQESLCFFSPERKENGRLLVIFTVVCVSKISLNPMFFFIFLSNLTLIPLNQTSEILPDTTSDREEYPYFS